MLSHFNDNSLFLPTFEKSSIGMALISFDGRFIKINPSLCKMLGYSESELINVDIPSVSHPEDLEAVLEIWNKLVQGEIDAYQIEKRYMHKSGTIMWGLLNVTAERNTQGIHCNDIFISQIVDITEQKRRKKSSRGLKNYTSLFLSIHRTLFCV